MFPKKDKRKKPAKRNNSLKAFQDVQARAVRAMENFILNEYGRACTDRDSTMTGADKTCTVCRVWETWTELKKRMGA